MKRVALIVQHHSADAPGAVARELEARGVELRTVRASEGDTVPPSIADVAGLVVMGGPFSIDDVEAHPYLVAELALIRSAVRAGVPILGAFPIKFQTGLDAIGLAFAMLLGIVCGLLFGLAPALQLARIDPQLALGAGSRTAGRSGMRNGLMAVQVGLALVVLMAAGLFVRNFTETRETDPGFRRGAEAQRHDPEGCAVRVHLEQLDRFGGSGSWFQDKYDRNEVRT